MEKLTNLRTNIELYATIEHKLYISVLKLHPVIYIIQLFFYFILIYKIMKKHSLVLKEQLSIIKRKHQLLWYKSFIFIVFSYEIFTIISNGLFQNYFILWCIFLLFLKISYLGFFGIYQCLINKGDSDKVILADEPEFLEKRKTINLDNEYKKDLYNKFIYELEINEKYIIPDINLVTIAKNINTNRVYLSIVINEYFNDNFYNVINKYRIEKAVKILSSKDNDKYTLLTIGKMVGYNYYSTFSNSFKKFKQMTPNQFKKNMQFA